MNGFRMDWMRGVGVAVAIAIAMTVGCREAQPSDAIGMAAFDGRTTEMTALLDADRADGAEINALVWAARGGQVAAIDALIARGAPLDAPFGVNDWSPLMHAIHKNQAAAVAALVAAGANVNFRAKRGVTPLILSAGQGEASITALLLEHGADPRFRNDAGVTALTNGVAAGNVEVVRAIVARAPELRLGATMWDTAARWLVRLRGDEEMSRLMASRSE
ncbi:MAG: ankyrin repeat domain-containing protein [bacterium]